MTQRLPTLSTLALGAAVPASLACGWQADHWMLGAAGAFTGLCLLGLGQRRSLVSLATSADDDAFEPPPAVYPPRRKRKSIEIDNKETADPRDLARQMVYQGRYALLLRPQIAATLDADIVAEAQAELDECMAIVPQGPVSMRSFRCEELSDKQRSGGDNQVQVEGYLLDRYLVSNADYQQFVDDGGYEQMSLWDESIWPAVLGFVDRTGQSGPKFWENGRCPEGKDDHPVVGVCWYEAAAFARWSGKRLPTDPEWVKVGSWPVISEGGHMVQRKYPWGDAMNRSLVRLWNPSRHSGTIPVHASPGSASVNGVQQLVGNVWEWTASNFGAWEPPALRVETAMPLKSIRGGAFDTYFETQCTCHFQSGESPLARKHNIGFRAAVGFCDLITELGATDDEAAFSPATNEREAA